MTEQNTGYDVKVESIIETVLEHDIQPTETLSMGQAALAIMESVIRDSERRGNTFTPQQKEYITNQIMLGL